MTTKRSSILSRAVLSLPMEPDKRSRFLPGTLCISRMAVMLPLKHPTMLSDAFADRGSGVKPERFAVDNYKYECVAESR